MGIKKTGGRAAFRIQIENYLFACQTIRFQNQYRLDLKIIDMNLQRYKIGLMNVFLFFILTNKQTNKHKKYKNLFIRCSGKQ